MNILERISFITLFFLIILIFYIYYNNINKNFVDIDSKEIILHDDIKNQDLKNSLIKANEYLKNAREFNKNGYIVNAIEQYYYAAKNHPDFMDAGSKDFLGSELKEAIRFSIVKLNQKLRINPDDKDIIARLKMAYKMERRFGQGCE